MYGFITQTLNIKGVKCHDIYNIAYKNVFVPTPIPYLFNIVLNDPVTLSRWVKWKDEDCPTGSSTKAITKSAVDMILNRLTKVINEWEQKNGVVDAIRDRVLKQFQRKFALMEDQMQKVEGMRMCSYTAWFFQSILKVVRLVKYILYSYRI